MKTLTRLNFFTRTIGVFIQAAEKLAPETFKVIDNLWLTLTSIKITPVTGVLER
jgi:hypothetical protein